MRVTVFSVAALLATMLVVCPAATTSADVIFSLDTGINGDFPAKVDPLKPALKATFKTNVIGSVELTLDATNLFPQEFIGNWLFNYIGDPVDDDLDILNPTSSVFLYKSSPPAQDGGPQVRAGLFNLELIFDTSNNPNSPNPSDRFQGGDTLVLTLTGTGITAEKFDGLSIDKPAPAPPTGGWSSAADIQGIPDGNGTTSGSIGAKPAAAVPEPSTVVLWSLMGVAGIGVGWWRKRSR